MYEYVSKKIQGYRELTEVCRKATSYFVDSFMQELILRREEWENPETKTAFINSFHQEYFAWDEGATVNRTRNRVNLVIRIIHSGMVRDALEYVANANSLKMDVPEAKENALHTLTLIENEKSSCEWCKYEKRI